MNNLLLISCLLIITIYSFIRLYKKIDIKIGIIYTLFNLSFIASILILVFFTSTYENMLLITIGCTLIFFFLMLLINHKYDSLDNEQLYALFRLSINSLLFVTVINFIVLYVIKNINSNYLNQLLFIGIGFIIFILLQIVYKKIKFARIIKNIFNKGTIHADIYNRIYTLSISILIILFAITIGSNSTAGNTNDTPLLSYTIEEEIVADFAIDSESNILDGKAPTKLDDYYSIDYFYSILDYEDDRIVLKAYDFENQIETTLLEFEYQPDKYQFVYMNFVNILFGDVYIHTHLGLYYLDGFTLTTVYEYTPNDNETQFVDYYTMFYKTSYTNPITNKKEYPLVLQTKTNVYFVEEANLIDMTGSYPMSFPDEDQFNSLKRTFGFSWNNERYYCYVSNNDLISIHSTNYGFDDIIIEPDELDEVFSELENPSLYSSLVYIDDIEEILYSEEFVINEDIVLVHQDTPGLFDENVYTLDFLVLDSYEYEIVFENGYDIVGSENHRYLLQTVDNQFRLLTFNISEMRLNTYPARCLNSINFFGFALFLLPIVRKEDTIEDRADNSVDDTIE